MNLILFFSGLYFLLMQSFVYKLGGGSLVAFYLWNRLGYNGNYVIKLCPHEFKRCSVKERILMNCCVDTDYSRKPECAIRPIILTSSTEFCSGSPCLADFDQKSSYRFML